MFLRYDLSWKKPEQLLADYRTAEPYVNIVSCLLGIMDRETTRHENVALWNQRFLSAFGCSAKEIRKLGDLADLSKQEIRKLAAKAKLPRRVFRSRRFQPRGKDLSDK